jgi:hypothetical protein
MIAVTYRRPHPDRLPAVTRTRTIIEPFRIHSVEPLRFLSEDEGRARVREAGYNLFYLHADHVLIEVPKLNARETKTPPTS